MRIYRIGDERHPLWDGMGAALVGGRWNSSGRPVLYGSLSYACAMLEILAHAGIGRIPASHRFIVVDVPDGVSVESHDAAALPPHWDADGSTSARAFGDLWLAEARSAVLIVPSVVARLDWNVLVNPLHPDAANLSVSSPEPVAWDQRLFTSRAERP